MRRILRTTLAMVSLVCSADAYAGYYDEACFPLIRKTQDMIMVKALTATITIEEWTICEGVGLRDASTLTTPEGDDDLARLSALIGEFNAGGGLDYEIVQYGSGGIGVRPAQAGLALTTVQVAVDGALQTSVGAAEGAVFDQLVSAKNVWIGPPALPTARHLQPVNLTTATTLGQALVQINDSAYGIDRRWHIRVWPQGAAYSGFMRGPNEGPIIVDTSGVDRDGDGIPDQDDPCPVDTGNDADMDGVCASAGDCDDQDASRYPGAEELCDDIDQDCDGDPKGSDCAETCAAFACKKGKVNVCHKPGVAAENTLCISENAVSPHIGHGDVCGTCQ